jgi:hypothetical protein
MLNSLFECFLLLHNFFVQGLVAKVVLQSFIVEFFFVKALKVGEWWKTSNGKQ